MNERFRLLRESKIEEYMANNPVKSIREIPLDVAYPDPLSGELYLEFSERLREMRVEMGCEINTNYPRNRKIHIMYLDHSICRKSKMGFFLGQEIELEYKTEEINIKSIFGRGLFCKKCWNRFRKYQKHLFLEGINAKSVEEFFYS
ncbi:MAG: hypothetical protein FK732_09270 [Asgard group archaeon]|nr:hypothetical protein [Asgard group archaeon]